MLEHQCPGEGEHCHADALSFDLDVQYAEEEAYHCHGEHTPEVDRTAAKVGHEGKPGDQSAYKCHGRTANLELVNSFSLKFNLLKHFLNNQQLLR
jgi:hypothetical protein